MTEHSLLSRFQGGLLGSALRSPTHSPGDLSRWEQIKQALLLHLMAAPATVLRSDRLVTPLLPNDWPLPLRLRSVAGLAWAIMPWFCRFHGSEPHLPPDLSAWVAGEPIALDWLWVWAIAVHHGLRGDWPTAAWQADLAQRYPVLAPVPAAIAAGWSRDQITARLGATPNSELPLALYCAWSTPEDIGVSLTRAQRHSPLTAALTATLMGLYHGQAIAPQAAEHPRWSTIQQLFAQWAGLDPQGQWHDAWEQGAIAPAGRLHAQHRRPFPAHEP